MTDPIMDFATDDDALDFERVLLPIMVYHPMDFVMVRKKTLRSATIHYFGERTIVSLAEEALLETLPSWLHPIQFHLLRCCCSSCCWDDIAEVIFQGYHRKHYHCPCVWGLMLIQ